MGVPSLSQHGICSLGSPPSAKRISSACGSLPWAKRGSTTWGPLPEPTGDLFLRGPLLEPIGDLLPWGPLMGVDPPFPSSQHPRCHSYYHMRGLLLWGGQSPPESGPLMWSHSYYHMRGPKRTPLPRSPLARVDPSYDHMTLRWGDPLGVDPLLAQGGGPWE